MEDLEERLKHSRAFEGLMSLIPAKQYYAEDQCNPSIRKKQNKEQKRAAMIARLDPANHKSAADIMAENERKRKRELAGNEADELSDLEASGKERPREGLKQYQSKKQKLAVDKSSLNLSREEKNTNTSRTLEQIEARRREKAERKREKMKLKNERKQDLRAIKQSEEGEQVEGNRSQSHEVEQIMVSETPGINIVGNVISRTEVDDVGDRQATPSSASSEPDDKRHSGPSERSTPSSASSIVPPTPSKGKDNPTVTKTFDKLQLPRGDQDALKARLAAKIEALRAARRADSINGKPAKNRQELMEARRKKEEERKQRKKEIKKLAKEEEDKVNAEAELARLRGSGSPLTPDVFSPARSPERYNFSFGKVTFSDGQQLDAQGTALQDKKTKKKGAADPKTALEAARKKEVRIQSFDEDKRSDIEQKDAWLNAKKRAHGERIRDDVSLLRKTLKRKEKAKAKSENEWTKRLDGVKKGQEIRQKRREENLLRRREEKGSKKDKARKPTTKKARPGFEGKFGQRS